MAYTPKKWVNLELITAEDLNHLEQGVANEQVGPQGEQGIQGVPGKDGKDGAGVPTGGTSGQVLAKRSAADYDTQWVDPPEGGGGAAGVTSFNGRTGAVVPASGDYTAAQVGALPVTGGTLTGNLTIKGSSNYGTKINLGDGDYVHISEPTDDCMEIKAKKINFVTSDTTDAKFTLNGEPIGGGGSSVSPATAAPKAPGTAAVGTSDKYAREDHIHPSQTSVSGNAGTATKLATARTIRTNLASASSASFDGSANVTPGVTGTLPIANGGTGAATAAAALTALGALAADGTAAAATKLATARTIDGISFSGAANIYHYAVCSTAAATAEKTVTKSGFTLATGARIAVKFTYANTAASPTLNVNSTGAKPIMLYGTTTPSSWSWTNKQVVEFVYDGTNFLVVNLGWFENPVFINSISLGRSSTSIRGEGSCVLGSVNGVASGDYSHAAGMFASANASGSYAYGYRAAANKAHSYAFGHYVTASAQYQHVIGTSNVESTNSADRFIIGKGTGTSTLANCLRVTNTGTYGAGAYNASGADYAELFEWADGNPDAEDRCGRFVTLDGEKIRLAGPGDDFILGIVSGNPSVVGDVHDDQWQGMYLYDIFGRPLWEDVEVPAETDPDGNVLIPAHTEHRQKLNPDYDSSQPYQPRTQRPEWDAVGMLGKLVAVDDGTCQVNGWCTAGEGGIATHSAERTKYHVMSRLDESHVRVLIL